VMNWWVFAIAAVVEFAITYVIYQIGWNRGKRSEEKERGDY
jgi:hypothetical protein